MSKDKKINSQIKLSNQLMNYGVFKQSSELPKVFHVKYLGCQSARGLWGIKHTRKPVDDMVSVAKTTRPEIILPLMKLIVYHEGIIILPISDEKPEIPTTKTFSIETISYGVQDVVYTKIFSMIVVRDNVKSRNISPFECHGFVCKSKHHARQLTLALAAAFQVYSMAVNAFKKSNDNRQRIIVNEKPFTIDLRTPDEINHARDSEA